MNDETPQESRDQADREVEIVKAAAHRLGEHFDTVQIIVTRHDPEIRRTWQLNAGVGNYYARYGSVRNWLMIEDGTPADEEGGGDS